MDYMANTVVIKCRNCGGKGRAPNDGDCSNCTGTGRVLGIPLDIQKLCLDELKTNRNYTNSLLERTVRCAQAAIHCLRQTTDCEHLTDDAIEERVVEDLAELYGYTDESVRGEFVNLVCGVLSRERKRKRADDFDW